MNTNERYRDETIRSWMRLVHRGATYERVQAYAVAYGECCSIGDAYEIRDTMERVREFLLLCEPTPYGAQEEEDWLRWWNEIKSENIS